MSVVALRPPRPLLASFAPRQEPADAVVVASGLAGWLTAEAISRAGRRVVVLADAWLMDDTPPASIPTFVRRWPGPPARYTPRVEHLFGAGGIRIRPDRVEVPALDLELGTGAIVLDLDVAATPDLGAAPVTGSRILVQGGGIGAISRAAWLRRRGARVVLCPPGALLWGEGSIEEFVREAVGAALETSGIVIEPAAAVDAVRESGLVAIRRRDGRRGWMVIDRVERTADTSPTAERLRQLLGVRLSCRGDVVVDQHGATSVPGVFAVGGLAGAPANLVAMSRMATAVAARVTGGQAPFDARFVPRALDAPIPAAWVGLSQSEAADLVSGVRSRFRSIPGDLGRFLAVQHRDRVLGVHALGPGARRFVDTLAVRFHDERGLPTAAVPGLS